ncbi:MAG: nitrate reductase subunit alpha [Calditrichaeota bacterium]|nr:nitrate reductase subunit alpha [Calditrichota bacterium]MCB9367538.1 nitrate reductase subunit alpha [Calditrichota bacterium]
MSWITDLFDPKQREWEDLYRNRWSYDKIIRSTHGVNCTGGCSWNIYVKNGIVTWEMQALDYPIIDKDIPPYEPRGCQRGISYSWYIYSPIRVKYPYVRGALIDLWREAKRNFPDNPVAAWDSIVSNPESRARYHSARGKGGLRRFSWDEALEILSAANIHTVQKHGPDRIAGFSPIPAMSMVSYAAGARFMQLMGGVSLSFYDWYCDLPPASPEIWGEQTDVAESADWFKSGFIAVVGSNVLMTRTPDAHFLVEARHRGAKVVVFSPDFSMVSKVSDEWVPIHQGQDSAFWMSVGHTILRENYVERRVPYFTEYQQRFTDGPILVQLHKQSDGSFKPGQYLRVSQVDAITGIDKPDWKFLMIDSKSGELRLPQGTIGHRWQDKKGQWNLKLEDERTGAEFDPLLMLDASKDELVTVSIPEFSSEKGDGRIESKVPVRKIQTAQGDIYVTTAFELLISSYGVSRDSSKPVPYDEPDHCYTPAWQEKFTGVSGDVVLRFARNWATTAEKTNGRCSVIIGAGVNHWYHNNLIYRSIISSLMLCGCVGKNGGGLNHYVGQEKLVPQTSWAPIAFGTDWSAPPRLQNTPSFHYVHSDQWRYDGKMDEVCPVADRSHSMASGHTMDRQIQAVRAGWLPSYPQFDQSSIDVAREARHNGAGDEAAIVKNVVERLKSKKLKFAVEDPDSPKCFPRIFYIWRGNALMSSAKGHEYFLKHYLGTHTNLIATERAKELVEDVTWHDKVELGKMDLVVDVNYRMDSSALYSDIILPAATYYEKNDLNSTDMHSFIHPLQAAVPACWESKSDWDIFREIARATSKLAEKHLPDPVEDVVTAPLAHDTPAEIAQPAVKDWSKGECEAIPGKTMPVIKVVTRDYKNVFNKFVSLGPNFRNGLGMHGIQFDVADMYDSYMENNPTEKWGGKEYPSLREDVLVCEAILNFAPETNGELAYRSYKAEAVRTGLDHSHAAEKTRSVRITFEDIAAQPRRILTTPFWTGVTNDNRTYSAYCQNVEGDIPWRTLSGRQHYYLDHETYIAYGENLPTYKPRPAREILGDLTMSKPAGGTLVLNYLTPHGKWSIHSTYGDTLRMRTLSRGHDPIWINDKDALLLGVEDNDWVEIFNDHGVVCTCANVSARIPRGMCFIYHSPERTIGIPKSPERGNRRAGGHNSLTRARLKPLFMIGGYGQFTYAFNYWGPPGVNRDTFVAVKKLEKINY